MSATAAAVAPSAVSQAGIHPEKTEALALYPLLAAKFNPEMASYYLAMHMLPKYLSQCGILSTVAVKSISDRLNNIKLNPAVHLAEARTIMAGIDDELGMVRLTTNPIIYLRAQSFIFDKLYEILGDDINLIDPKKQIPLRRQPESRGAAAARRPEAIIFSRGAMEIVIEPDDDELDDPNLEIAMALSLQDRSASAAAPWG
jgi:hypothetical protein